MRGTHTNEAAKQWYEENGNLKIPKSYVTESGLTLGAWINTPEACEVRQYIRKPHLGKDTKAKRHRHDMGCYGFKLAGGN